MDDVLKKHRDIWQRKKILRHVYESWYQLIARDLQDGDGKTLELGAGCGNFKGFYPAAVATDIEYCAWLDMILDAHTIPFCEGSVQNIIMIDVLHHLSNPICFLKEAARVLRRGGRIIMLEPYPSLFSFAVYKKVHPEPFLMDIDYFNRIEEDIKNSAEANQAIPFLIFYRHIRKFLNIFENEFTIIKRKRLSCILYPASGGFDHKAFIPDFLVPFFRMCEFLLIPFSQLLAFRCYIVLERR